jgi:hypothetical protein
VDDKSVKLAIELSADVHRHLLAYRQILVRQTGHTAVEPAKLIAPMSAQFMATDRAFAKLLDGTFNCVDIPRRSAPNRGAVAPSTTVPAR